MLTPNEEQAIKAVVISDNITLMKLCVFFALTHPELLVVAQQEIEDRAILN